jgi:hypothetical protein
LSAILHCNIVPFEYGGVPDKITIMASMEADAFALDQRKSKQERNGNV